MGQSAPGFVFSKLQAADVLQAGPVLVHLLIDDQLHAPTGAEISAALARSGRQRGGGGGYVRCGFANVLDALQRVSGVRAAKDAGGEHDGEGVGRHPVCVLLQSNPVTHRGVGRVLILAWTFTEYQDHSHPVEQTAGDK